MRVVENTLNLKSKVNTIKLTVISLQFYQFVFTKKGWRNMANNYRVNLRWNGMQRHFFVINCDALYKFFVGMVFYYQDAYIVEMSEILKENQPEIFDATKEVDRDIFLSRYIYNSRHCIKNTKGQKDG
jgi:hypothetical protein